MKSYALALMGVLFTANALFANDLLDWANRPNVIRAAERLATEVEHFDEALHDVNAPAHFIQKVHHFEETATEFVEIARFGTYQQAYSEFNHIRQDMKMIQQELSAHPYLMQNFKVATEYRAMRTAYRSVDHEMFMWDKVRWSPAKVKQLQDEIEAMDRH